MGTAQNRKVYARHGSGPNTFGVSFADLGKLQKQTKRDHALACQLWETGNQDARLLATMIADPGQMTAAGLDTWAKDLNYYVLADSFARHLASQSRLARRKVEQWTKSREDFTGQAGYSVQAILAMENPDLPDAYFEKHLETIERRIHQAGNRTRHAMNSAVIAIGLRNAHLQHLALAAASRIGKVVVDHGETGCKTPDAIAYIQRAAQHKSKRGKKK